MQNYRGYLLPITFILLAFARPSAQAQEIKGTHWIINVANSPSIKVKYLNAVRSDSLIISNDSGPVKIPVSEITSLIKVKKHAIAKGAIIGGISGFILGGVWGGVSSASLYEPGATASMVLGGEFL